MIEFSEILTFFNSRSYEILGEIFDDIESWSKEKKLEYGWYKDDQFLNSLYIVVPQKERVILLLCPQGHRRFHCLHFSKDRFIKLRQLLLSVDFTVDPR